MAREIWQNLIFISYVGGTNGKAICRILEFSPDAYSYDNVAHPGPSGDMHHRMTTPRYSGGSLNIFDFASDMGINYDPTSEIEQTFAQHYRETFEESRVSNHQSTMEVLAKSKLIAADHIPALHQSLIFPGSKVIATNGYLPKIARTVADKWFLQPHPLDQTVSVIQYECARQGKVPTVRNLKQFFRAVVSNFDKIMTMNDSFEKSYHLTYHQLFDPSTSYDTYHDLVAWCGLQPNWPEVEQFIHKYNAVQPRRAA